MLCYVMLCYVMLCYVMLCYVMFCYNRSPLSMTLACMKKCRKFRAELGPTLDLIQQGATALPKAIQKQKQAQSRIGADFLCERTE